MKDFSKHRKLTAAHRLIVSPGLALVAAALTAGALGIASPAWGQNVLYLYGFIDSDGDRPGEAGYDGKPFHPMRLDNVSPTASNPNATDFNRGMSGFKTALEERGMSVSQQIDSAITLDAGSLADVDVLILGSNNRRFTAAETAAVNQWVNAGGGLVAWSDSAFGGDFRQVGVGNPTGSLSDNDLTAQFGMTFLTDNGKDVSGPASKQAGSGIVQWEVAHFINNFQTDGLADDGIVFYGEGVSYVRIDPASGAVALARAQNSNAPPNPATDVPIAINQVGAGRVVGVFDRNTFWNNGEGTDLFEVDNREFAQNLVQWAAVPEPATAALLGLGGLMVGLRRRARSD